MRASLLLTSVALSLPLAWAVACSSSSSGNGGGPTDDGGQDASSQDGTTPGTEGGGSSGGKDGTAGGDATSAEGGMVLKVTQTNLFADTAEGGAPHVDPNLVNAWGLAFSPTGIAWISDNGSGLATLYQAPWAAPLPRMVTIPAPGASDAGPADAGDAGPAMGTPTGQLFNPGAAVGDFMGDNFILSTEDGTVAGWSSTANPFDDAGAATATLKFDNSAAGAVYKGLAIVPSTPPVLLLADFHNARVDVLDRTYHKVTTGTDAGADGGAASGAPWTDPSVPTGFAPFNIAVLGGKVFVTYAMQKAPDNHDDQAGPGNGAISVFDMTGTLVKSLVKTGGALDSPWGLAMAPAGWGQVGGMLVVGNFGDGRVNAYDPASGAWMASFATSTGAGLKIDGLWSLVYGVSSSGGDGGADGGTEGGISPNQLFFTDGPNMEMNGLFGYLTPQ
ncbi:MAG: TIGR03118 family protein [Polyangiaceae bacterium]